MCGKKIKNNVKIAEKNKKYNNKNKVQSCGGGRCVIMS